MMLVAERECEHCGAEIATARSEGSTRRIPLDLEPDPAGNIVLRGDIGHILAPGERTNEPRYLSHFITCAETGIFRRGANEGRSAA